MNVRLIAVSRPVIDEVPGSAELLAFCARVSSTNQKAHETGGKLLRSLVRRKEWSPFEMVSLTIEIETTRDIARQILRHRSFSFQEFSQRYAVVHDEFIPREARLQDQADRQGSIAVDDDALADWWRREQMLAAHRSKLTYEDALERGIAKEVARSVLPEGMTPSRLYMAGTLRSWIHYVQLRTGTGTQKEHRDIAFAIAGLLQGEFPDLGDLIGGGESDG